jgi:hypothetical protein
MRLLPLVTNRETNKGDPKSKNSPSLETKTEKKKKK